VSVFISYSHDSAEHMDRVLALSNRLRQEGVDCRIDQYEQSPSEGWPQWCEKQVEQSGFVLVACTETYLRRFKGEEAPGKGLGGTWEGHIITQELYNAQGENSKFIPIIFSEQDAPHIPVILQGATHYQISEEGYERFYRRLTNQPLIQMPTLGAVKPMAAREVLPSMPALARQQDFLKPWNVPYSRNTFFTGREKVLAGVEKELHASGLAALTGMGGVGKTQIAAHFAHEHRDEYSAVFWVSSASQETLVSDFAAIASLLNLPGKDEKDQALAVAAVKRWLEGSQNWLLIFDNAGDLATVRGFIPQSAKGHVLLTTQAQATGDIQAIEILDMLPEDGALLLLRRAKFVKPDATLTAARDSDRDIAVQISTALGGLPLALDQAGAYLEETGCGLASYLDLYRQRRAELLKRRGGFSPPHPESVATTFALSFEKVAGASHAAADLLRVCAFLRPEAIPEEIFTQGAAELGPNLGPIALDLLKLDAACAEILKYSLVRRDADAKTVGIHRLVQGVIQDGLTEEEKHEWAERAVRAVNQAFPSVEFANWAQCKRFVPQALASAALIEAYGLEFEGAARLLNQAGHYLYQRARFSEAEPLHQRALAVLEKVLGPEDAHVAASLNSLGVLYRAQGKYAEAGSLHERALAIRKRVLEPGDPDLAVSLLNLGDIYRARGKFADAEPLVRQALTISRKASGPEHPDVGSFLNALALLYHEQGKYAEAEPLYVEALTIRRKALTPDHPHLATSYGNLASLYHKQRRYTEAEALFEQALVMRQRVLGPEHPDLANSLTNMAELYQDQGKYAQADAFLQQALTIREKRLGSDHPSVAQSLNNLAGLYTRQGRFAEAEPLYQRALAIANKALGPDHPNVATVLENYAHLHREMKRGAAARELEARAQAIRAAHAQENPAK
jgi:tetratricopeptide (TPR) repeat protein